MDQLSVGKEAAGKIDITAPLGKNIETVALSLGKKVSEVTVAILLRDRNQDYIDAARRAGARVVLFDHGTVSHGLAPAIATWEIDMMAGIGGAPEAVITAAGIKALGGDMQAVLKPHNEKSLNEARRKGMDTKRVYQLNDLVQGETLFVATGVSPSPILKGVLFETDRIVTHSLEMRSSTKTVRFIESHHME
jgi:fructose-1,6-bisphosphatase II